MVSKKLKKAFGVALREVRKGHGVSQLAVSIESGLDRTYMSELERGIKNPSLETIFRLSEAIGVSPVELVKRTIKHLK